jgi:putative ABC transport system permease protein
VAVASGILTGLAPALRFSRADLNDALKENARSSTAGESAGKLRGLLVAFETALALILLVGAGLMVNGFHNLLTAKMGFDRGDVLTFHVVAPKEKYQSKEQVRNYYERVLEQLRTLPSVESAASVSSLPSSRNWNWTEYTAEGQAPALPGELRSTISQIVTPEFLTTLRVPLLEGRFLSPLDGANAAPVAVVSESMARAAWPNDDPLGKHLKLGTAQSTGPERRVVGVVGDVKPSPFTIKPQPTAYVPFAQGPQWTASIAVRTSGNPLSIAPAVAEIMRGIDPTTPAYDIRTLRQVVADDLSGVESAARMMIVFGCIALLLAAAGIFAVMAYSVTQRTHEIGIRMALGARPRHVLRLVVSSGMKMAVLGLAVGLGASLLLARAIASVMYGVIRVEPVVFVALTATLAMVAGVAAYVPARWATKVDPMRALRCD